MTATIQNALSKKGSATVPSTMDLVRQMEPGIRAALPSTITPERFTRIALSALSSTPKLQECTGHSFLAALMTSAQLGLEPNTPLGQAWLIPYWNGKTNRLECQFQLGYRGLLDLAYRSGQIRTIHTRTVFENDVFEYAYGLDQKLCHIPARQDRGDPTHFYCLVDFENGGRLFDVMTVDEIRAHAQRFSKSYNNGPWQTDFEAMARKTVLKRVLKYAPLAVETMRAITQDGSVREEISDDMSSVVSITEYEDNSIYEPPEEVPQNDASI